MTSRFDDSEYDPKHPDRAKIDEGYAVPCRICELAFARLRPTWRYCAGCGRGFCEGEHGNFAGPGPGRCVRCGPQPSTDPSEP